MPRHWSAKTPGSRLTPLSGYTSSNAPLNDMDDDHASPRDLLDDLTRLSQAGRLRYLKKLSRNDLIEVLSLTLQTKDDGGDMMRNEAFLTRTRTPVLLNEKCESSHDVLSRKLLTR
jgi:hypothetical protein